MNCIFFWKDSLNDGKIISEEKTAIGIYDIAGSTYLFYLNNNDEVEDGKGMVEVREIVVEKNKFDSYVLYVNSDSSGIAGYLSRELSKPEAIKFVNQPGCGFDCYDEYPFSYGLQLKKSQKLESFTGSILSLVVRKEIFAEQKFQSLCESEIISPKLVAKKIRTFSPKRK